MGCCLPTLRHFDLIVEIFVAEFVLVPLFPTVPTSDYDSVCSASASFWWLLSVLRGLDRFAIICALIAYVTALCSPLKGPSNLFYPFSTFCIYFHTVLVCVGFVGSPPNFSFLRSSTPSSFRIRSGKDHFL